MEDINKEQVAVMARLLGYDAIPRNRYMAKVHEVSGLPFSHIGRLMKQYDRRIIVAAVLFAKRYGKADKIEYVISIIERMKYFIDARKGK